MNKKNYHFPIVIEKDEDGFFAVCPGLPGCYSQGNSYEEVVANMEDAVRLNVEERIAEREVIREPKSVSFLTLQVAL